MQKLLTEISLDGKWTEVSGDNNAILYLIALKDASTKTIAKIAKSEDAIDPELVDKVFLEVGIESGVEGKYLAAEGFALSFSDFTSNDSDLNKISAFVTRRNYFSKFYIRPTKIELKDGTILKEGKCALSLNINLL